MKEFPYLFGQLLKVSDALHEIYCKVMRDNDVPNTLAGSGEREVESKQLGNMVIERLKDLDEVAYVRFASVYRQFKDINSFIDELEKMLHEKNGNS